jgi:sialic acid synthase SpsE
MKIGSRDIGPAHPIFIVAEVGSNWRTLEDCGQSIVMAADAGADAIKFQMFTQEELYGFGTGLPRTHELPRDWIRVLAERAKMAGIEFMCSAFSEEGVAFVDPYVAAHKVASAEASHPGIVHACRLSSKPTFVSSGALEWSEFLSLLALDWKAGVIPTYCRASYPANDAQPWRMAAWDGIKALSDHSPDVFPVALPLYGYNAIEKHVNFVGAKGPDADHSLSARDFGRMVRFARYAPEDEHPPEEMLRLHRRRVVTIPNGKTGFYRIPG